MYWGFILYGEGGVVLIEVGLQRWFYANLKKSDNSQQENHAIQCNKTMF